MSNLYDYLDAGFKVFGIHGVDKDGVCGCGNPQCKALFKHPTLSAWQSVPHWSDEQIEYFEKVGHFKTGFGVLCSGYLIIDVDARNGGVESFKKLCQDIPEAGQAAFVVNTGSGGGSQHHYFSLPEPVALLQNHPRYSGIDWKTSGYVIASGSLHASGNVYEDERGHPQDITPAPDALVELLRRPDRYRVQSPGGGDVDVSEADIRALVGHIQNTDATEYDTWIKIGMAIHHCLHGDGFDIWQDWSAKGPKHDPTGMDRKWHSFGKSASPAGYGTLLHYAREGGYKEPVTFVFDDEELASLSSESPLDISAVDVLRPPGFVGELTQWINDRCLFPRERMAVAAALYAMSCVAGMRYRDEMDDMAPNFMAFCVGGSGSGKEAIIQAVQEILRATGVQSALHGGFKSEQEIYRNLVRHQAAFYVIDELGITLRKLENASKKGGASYLEGVVGHIMSIYSKATGYLPITGDLKETIQADLVRELSKNQKLIDDLPEDSSSDAKRGRYEQIAAGVLQRLQDIDAGLKNPYLCVMGFTTPVTFDDLMGFESATNGFMARALIFNEPETNPKRKRGFKKAAMTDTMQATLQSLYAPGVYDMSPGDRRVEFIGDKVNIPTDDDAAALLDQVYDSFHDMAEEHKGATGMEAIPRRGYEIASKASLLLAIPGGVRTVEHVRYGYALALRDVQTKIQMAYSTENSDKASGLAARVLTLVDSEDGESIAVIANRTRKTKEEIIELVEKMEASGQLKSYETNPKKGKKTKKYKKK